MKTRVLLLIRHLTDGGAQRVVTLWAKMLADAHYDVTVLTYYASANEYALDPRVTRANLVPSYQDYVKFAYEKKAFRELLKQYLTRHPQDVVIPFLTSCNLVAVLCEQAQPQIITQTIRNSPWNKEYGFKLDLRNWAIRRQGSVILQNAEQATYFDTPEFQHLKKYIVHNPLNAAIIKIKKPQYRSIKKIVAVGRLVPQKNQALMIEAIRILRDEYHEIYALDIYGAGKLQDELQNQINAAQLDNQIKLCGYNTNIFHTLINYDLFLMTSLHEGMPNALLESMGLGLPALAIKCRTGIAELIDDGKNGYTIEGYDAHALAKKIRDINQPTQLEKIGKQARQDMIERYAPDKIQNELITAIKDLCANPPKITPISLKTVLEQCPHQTAADFQNYFECSLEIIKIADYQLGQQIFDCARQVLQGVTVELLSDTKQTYYTCLQTNQFDHFYQYLQSKSAINS